MAKDKLEAQIEEEKAVLLSVCTSNTTLERVMEYLEELAFLVDTAGGVPVKKFVQNLAYPDPKTYFGSGKLDEVHEYIKENDIDLAVFDDESPVLVRNIVHSPEQLAQFDDVLEQQEFRRQLVLDELQQAGIPVEFDAVIGRGGLVKPLEGGVYE
ncbi:MAG: hypothetical protein J6S87_02320, partial [Bacteroidales bacterium]|nr:hypothetical protein [Bacteroidales bacterium]